MELDQRQHLLIAAACLLGKEPDAPTDCITANCGKVLAQALVWAESGQSADEPKQIWFNEEHSLMPWPLELPNDLGSVYVGIEDRNFVEAVTVTVTQIDGKN